MRITLYERDIQEANRPTQSGEQYLNNSQVGQDEMPVFSELTRRLGYEYNGIMLHEYYRGNLKPQAEDPQPSPACFRTAEAEIHSTVDCRITRPPCIKSER